MGWIISGKDYTDQEAIDARLLTSQQIHAYNALSVAAERIGRNTPRTSKRHFTPTPAHIDVINAMRDVLSGKITPEEAMGVLWEYDVMKERLAEHAS
jgi:hypothetical protein